MKLIERERQTSNLRLDRPKNQGEFTFCLAGKAGDQARTLLEGNASKIWECEAECHFEAMTKYYEFQGWGKYTTDFVQDHWSYVDESGKTTEPAASVENSADLGALGRKK